jgi:hypothetical protein
MNNTPEEKPDKPEPDNPDDNQPPPDIKPFVGGEELKPKKKKEPKNARRNLPKWLVNRPEALEIITKLASQKQAAADEDAKDRLMGANIGCPNRGVAAQILSNIRHNRKIDLEEEEKRNVEREWRRKLGLKEDDDARPQDPA